MSSFSVGKAEPLLAVMILSSKRVIILKKTSFIIAEYNPLHNGHVYHIEQTRLAGAERIIVLMSGDFVQRGEPALLQKHLRAKAAVEVGANLVLEIPQKYVLCGTGHFADGAAKIIASSGLNGTLSFGAESELADILKTADAVCDNSVQQKVTLLCKEKGFSYPRALQSVVNDIYGKQISEVLSFPNNLLAVNYINALKKYDCDIDFFSVKRQGVSHDSDEFSGGNISAKMLRELILNNTGDISEFVPDYSFDIISEALNKGNIIDYNRYNLAAISRLQTLSTDDLMRINGVNQGLENLFYDAIKTSCDLYTVCENVKSKRFTSSRLRQICTCGALGITKTDAASNLSYVNVLGFDTVGRNILHEIKKISPVPFVTLLSQAQNLSTPRDACLDERTELFYNLCTRNPSPNFSPYRQKPFIEK